VQSDDMIDHIVKLVEAKAALIDAGEAVSADDMHGKAA
jgi:(E)-4-hydroxy-3-methylbut-2-enyl-diphosphate synthase